MRYESVHESCEIFFKRNGFLKWHHYILIRRNGCLLATRIEIAGCCNNGDLVQKERKKERKKERNLNESIITKENLRKLRYI